MKRYDNIMQDNTVAPKTENNIWLKDSKLYYFFNGKWTVIGGDVTLQDMNAVKEQINGVDQKLQETNTALESKADISDIPDVSGFFDNAEYRDQRIYFQNNGKDLAYIEAAPFIKDGMVNDVTIQGENLVVIFNTEAGKDPITIPIKDIFDPSNYYNKEAVDAFIQGIKESIDNVIAIHDEDRPLIIQVFKDEKRTQLVNWHGNANDCYIKEEDVQPLNDAIISGRNIILEGYATQGPSYTNIIAVTNDTNNIHLSIIVNHQGTGMYIKYRLEGSKLVHQSYLMFDNLNMWVTDLANRITNIQESIENITITQSNDRPLVVEVFSDSACTSPLSPHGTPADCYIKLEDTEPLKDAMLSGRNIILKSSISLTGSGPYYANVVAINNENKGVDPWLSVITNSDGDGMYIRYALVGAKLEYRKHLSFSSVEDLARLLYSNVTTVSQYITTINEWIEAHKLEVTDVINIIDGINTEIGSINTKLEGVTKAAEDSEVIKTIGTTVDVLNPNAEGKIYISDGKGIILDTPDTNSLEISADTDYLATKKDFNELKEYTTTEITDIKNNKADRTDIEEVEEEVNDKIESINEKLYDVVLGSEAIDSDTFEEYDRYTKEELAKELFIKLWNTAVGKYGTYNEETGFFELNGLTDITFEQALDIYVNGRTEYLYPKRLGESVRTNILQRGSDRIYTPSMGFSAILGSICNYAMKCEVLRLTKDMNDLDNPDTDCGLIVESMGLMTYGAVLLKKIIGYLDLRNFSSISTSVFNGANRLEELYIKNLKCNFAIDGKDKLKIQCFKFLVKHASNTSVITVKVHPNVYAKLTDPENTEWYQVNQDALAKNITFAAP